MAKKTFVVDEQGNKLGSFDDLIRTEVGAEFHVTQKPMEVVKIDEQDDQTRLITVREK